MTDNINNSENEVKSGKATRRSWGRRVMRTLWWVFGIGVVVLFLFFILAYNGVIGYMPPVEELRNPQDKYASIIYTADGKEWDDTSEIQETASTPTSTKFRRMW